MEKIKILLIGMLIILGVIIVILSTNLSTLSLTSLSISSPEANSKQNHQNLGTRAWTKAICTKDHFCQDYLIECQNQEPVKLSPITGSSVKFDNSWQDPRNLEQRERLC
ncbi:hypothetical protein HY212_04120 [Candidatus Pacearchaeota archaeon]|nr:hypothetical protein [Candidatus Pacearchaeota archaeon]